MKLAGYRESDQGSLKYKDNAVYHYNLYRQIKPCHLPCPDRRLEAQ
jgi:hypothetical protein